jgi:hypothetical protein
VTRIKGTLREDQYTIVIISCSVLLRMRIFSDEIFRHTQNTHCMFSNFSQKIVSFMRWCGKIWWSLTVHRRQYSTAHALCKLDNYGYSHTHRICPTILTAFQRQQWLLQLTSMFFLYLHWLSCSVRSTGSEEASWPYFWHHLYKLIRYVCQDVFVPLSGMSRIFRVTYWNLFID